MAEIVVYYHLYNRKHGTVYLAQPQSQLVVASDIKNQNTGISDFLVKISKFLVIVGIGLILFAYAPDALAWSKNLIAQNVAGYQLSNTEVQKLTTSQVTQVTKESYIPPYDSHLSDVNILIIPSIGVKTPLQEATYDNYESALEKGVWRVSDFGSPADQSIPTILAAHRFGYISWTDIFRRQNSFYNLPNLRVGDTIEIDYQHRKYIYEVYAGDTGEAITDYSADLILYTCENLTGSERIFRYAKLIRSSL